MDAYISLIAISIVELILVLAIFGIKLKTADYLLLLLILFIPLVNILGIGAIAMMLNESGTENNRGPKA